MLAPRGITNATVNCPGKTDIRDHRNTALGFPLPGHWLRTKLIECAVKSGGSEGTVTATAGPVSAVAPTGGGYGGATTVPVPGVGDFKANVRDIQVDLIERNAQEEEPGLSQVACPSSSKPRKGATFSCTAKIPGGGFGVVIVDQTSEDSNVEVRALGHTLRSRRAATDAALRESLRRRGGLPRR